MYVCNHFHESAGTRDHLRLPDTLIGSRKRFVAELRAHFARAWAELHSLVNLSIPENLVIT